MPFQAKNSLILKFVNLCENMGKDDKKHYFWFFVPAQCEMIRTLVHKRLEKFYRTGSQVGIQAKRSECLRLIGWDIKSVMIFGRLNNISPNLGVHVLNVAEPVHTLNIGSEEIAVHRTVCTSSYTAPHARCHSKNY